MSETPDPRYGADGRTYAECIETRNSLAEEESKIGESFDKHLLTLASGALGLSILFVEKIAPLPQWTLLLAASWIAFAVCILACLLAILLAQASMIRLAEINRNLYELGPEGTDTTNSFADRVGYLNWIALTSFILGVLLFVLFAAANQKGTLMSNRSSTSSVPSRPTTVPSTTRSPQGIPIVTPKPSAPAPSAPAPLPQTKK